MIIGFNDNFYESIKSDSCLKCRFYKKDASCEMNKKIISNSSYYSTDIRFFYTILH